MPFLTKLVAQYDPVNREWELHEPLVYKYRHNERDIVIVPAGIRTDLASTKNIPGFPQDGPYNAEAVLHDFLYQGEFIQRKKADEIFRYALIENKAVPRWQPQIMYIAVRLFGGLTYKQHSLVSVARARQLAGVEPDLSKRPLWPDNTMRFK